MFILARQPSRWATSDRLSWVLPVFPFGNDAWLPPRVGKAASLSWWNMFLILRSWILIAVLVLINSDISNGIFWVLNSHRIWVLEEIFKICSSPHLLRYLKAFRSPDASLKLCRKHWGVFSGFAKLAFKILSPFFVLLLRRNQRCLVCRAVKRQNPYLSSRNTNPFTHFRSFCSD